MDELPENLLGKLRLVADLPETAKAGLSYSMFGLGGILLFCAALLIWKRMRSKSYGSSGISNAQVEFEKRTDGVTVHGQKGAAVAMTAGSVVNDTPTSKGTFRYT